VSLNIQFLNETQKTGRGGCGCGECKTSEARKPSSVECGVDQQLALPCHEPIVDRPFGTARPRSLNLSINHLLDNLDRNEIADSTLKLTTTACEWSQRQYALTRSGSHGR
jgi:hypothetical protein